jgi:hypothetical protein
MLIQLDLSQKAEESLLKYHAMKKASLLFFVLIVAGFASCDKNNDDPKPDGPASYELYIDFWNEDGTSPQIIFDAGNSSPEVKIDFSKTFTGVSEPPNLTKVIVDNVRIIDENNTNYKIEKITAYEWRDALDDWKEDVEFIMSYKVVEDVAVILNLDASASLGADFSTVKEYAIEFVRRIFASMPSARFGIVDFSDLVYAIGPTTDSSAIIHYIKSIDQGQFTSLYEAMYLAIDSLQQVEAEGKAIVTFTDGTDNNSDPMYTPEVIYDLLVNDPNGIKVNSFTIGLEGNGGVDKAVLEKLAANGGVAEFPEDMDELGEVFDKFSKSIANVYNLTYIRNQQVIPQTSPARLRFVIEASPK